MDMRHVRKEDSLSEEQHSDKDSDIGNGVLKFIVQSLDSAVIIVNEDGIVKLWNRVAELNYGWKAEEVLNEFYPLIESSEKERFREFIRSSKKEEGLRIKKIKKKDGFYVETLITNIPLENDDDLSFSGLLIKLETLKNEIDVDHKIVSTLKELEDIKYALDESSIVATTDPNGTITYVNNKFCEISKYSKSELLGSNHNIIKSGFHSSSFFQDMWKTIKSGQVWRGEVKNKAKDGSFYWVHTTIVPFLNENKEPYQFVAIRTDISERKKVEQECNYLITHDELTGLSNIKTLKDTLSEIIETKPGDSKHVGILLIDLDRFKFVNESNGHSFGDLLIISVAERLQACLKKTDTLARYSGDEFIIILNHRTKDEIEATAKRILTAFEQPFKIMKKPIYTTCSIGISLYPDDGLGSETLIKQADIAMHIAKDLGRNKYEFYNDYQTKDISREIEIEHKLRTAIENNEFTLHYQPKLDLNSNRISSVEALIRWNNGDLGSVSPAEFIPIAESSGQINEIGQWVLQTACQQMKEWLEEDYFPSRVAINLSVLQFKDKNLVKNITEVLNELNLPAKYLELEITENISMNDSKVVKETLDNIKDIGVYISIDDFGTGYSSLSYLRAYPVDCLKIDKTFIDEIISHNNPSILKGIIALAQGLQLSIVAEGVETKEQVEFLVEHGCTEIQGYYFCRPIPADELRSFISNQINSSLVKCL